MKPIVYIDLDGVLSDFVTGIHKAMGVEYDIHNWPYPREWDFFSHAPFSFAQANAKCTSKFWAELPWMEDGPDILGVIQRYALPTDCAILTRPMDHLGSYTGKARWVNKHVPDFSKRLIPTWIDKHELAHPKAVLIDDRPESIAEFREAGGHGILVPRPWNEGHSRFERDMTVTYIEQRLIEWVGKIGFKSRGV